ncbi:hypothetical protein MXB_1601 [Myxobolus squamalis]|nr:hypothetical protein MXB_1601 [Myxobolus squamalis]
MADTRVRSINILVASIQRLLKERDYHEAHSNELEVTLRKGDIDVTSQVYRQLTYDIDETRGSFIKVKEMLTVQVEKLNALMVSISILIKLQSQDLNNESSFILASQILASDQI